MELKINSELTQKADCLVNGENDGNFKLRGNTKSIIINEHEILKHWNQDTALASSNNGGSGSNIFLRPYGVESTTNQAQLYPNGTFNAKEFTINGGTALSTRLNNRKRICIGSQVLYDTISGSGGKSKTALIGAYSYTLIDGVFSSITIPSGWHKEYRITFQATTSGECTTCVYVNNIATSTVRAWSGNTFRTIGGSNFFKESDITLETTFGYTNPGTNLYYSITDAGTNNWTIWNITVHGFLVED